ncbi:efflux RND transporter periplasmic adaptor subunit [Paenibacillus eucommiae]|uniref:RND family efflux transporter MFP subunit n=1 Tax=Paenibacillus eucommiae TaxID=1355755 RepID=A0ABS4IP83_9BACL|nr:biotin/lipoyl-binding protein [Paenibacillus eucommiae]MBP1989373.1 RND family efflux transporter MFP subunit [Paenibacillus eucommiae]
MESGINKRAEAGKKQTIKIIAGLFFGVLFICTFFSNTLLSLTLPKVLTQQAVQGSLSHTIEGSGILSPLEAVELRSDTAWKVATLNVKNGDSVVKGQALITFDSKAPELQILNEQTALKQQKLQLEGFFDSYVEASRNGDASLIKAAKREVDKYKLGIEAQERSIQALQVELANNRQMLAPYAGIVTKVNATEGVPSPTLFLSNTSRGFGLSVTLDANNASLLNIGDTIEVEVKEKKEKDEKQTKIVEGEITEIEPTQSDESLSMNNKESSLPAKSIHIQLQDESLKGGEIGSIHLRITVPTEKNTLLISNAAIHEDQTGKYVYVVEERKGTLGNGFYVGKSYIKVVDANENQSAVQEGIFNMQEVIIESSEPLQEGERVRL